MSKQEIMMSGGSPARSLAEALRSCHADKLFLLTDETTFRLCLPLVQESGPLQEAETIVIGAGDVHKTIETLSCVWKQLGDLGASRHSLLVNLGGGMVTDLGGFAASTFKRGIPYLNVPTTLLAMVDAAVGGKTGINFNGLKNEVGVFAPARSVIIDTAFLRTLDRENRCSGYAEMVKHGLISDEKHWADLLAFDIEQPDYAALQPLVARSVAVKEAVVEQDPLEKGLRKALNFGHTVGHAFESLALEEGRPCLHGYAVAWGMVCELYFSCLRTGFPKEKLHQTVRFIKEHYGTFVFDCNRYERLYQLMTHDKKNEAGIIRFTLLADIGEVRIDQSASKEEIFGMLDFYRETMGC